MKIRTVGAALFHARRHDKLTVTSRQFCERPLKQLTAVGTRQVEWTDSNVLQQLNISIFTVPEILVTFTVAAGRSPATISCQRIFSI